MSAKPRRTRRAAAARPEAPGNGAVSYTETAVEIIRDRILDLTLQPGARIDDTLLMEQFGMGRTPAREAFNRLATEGLIVIQRHRGAFVRPLDIQHVRQLIDAYAASERTVGYFCNTRQPALLDELTAIERQYEEAQAEDRYLDMTRLNSAFHRRIAAACENEYIFEHASRLYNHARRLSYFIYLTPGFAPRDYDEMQAHITDDHAGITNSIRNHDNAQLVAALTEHVRFFHASIIGAIGGVRGLSAPLPALRP